jgi:hypothetical protein
VEFQRAFYDRLITHQDSRTHKNSRSVDSLVFKHVTGLGRLASESFASRDRRFPPYCFVPPRRQKYNR